MKRWFIGILLAAFPWLAPAQLLDFDSVCAAPPCAIGSLYAPAGVTMAPNSAPIVAGGTNGLSGLTGGGRYLSMAAFPYQATITLARQATFFSMQLSRANTSSGTVTVAVTWLKGGVPVSNTNVVLTNVDTWSTASANVPGGFDSIFLSPSGGANLTFGIDGMQFGGTCNGFGDVQPSDSFCNASEWLANRGVTLGCATGQYCPGQNVTRAQMALFMQRLGDAVAPFVAMDTGGVNNDTLAGTPTPCFTEPIPPAPYRRVAIVSSTANLFSFSGPKTVAARIVYSINEGQSWLSSPGFFMDVSGDVGDRRPLSEAARMPLEAGVAYLLGVRYSSSSMTTVILECELIATISPQRPGASAPFDAPSDSVAQEQPR